MYRLMGRILPAQREAEVRQENPPFERPLKRETGREFCSRNGEIHRPQMLGRPVTSAVQRSATPVGVALLAFGAGSGWIDGLTDGNTGQASEAV